MLWKGGKVSNTRARLLRLVVMLSLVVVACGSGLVDSTTPETTATTLSATLETPNTTSSSTTVALNEVNEARFDEMRQLVESTGFVCSTWRYLGSPPDKATCTSTVIFTLHEDESGVEASVLETDEDQAELGYTTAHVVGTDWAVHCKATRQFDKTELCEDIQGVLGGELIPPTG